MTSGIALRGESRTGQVETEHFRRLQRLEEVVSSLERDYNDWHVPWGEVNRLQRIASSGEELSAITAPVIQLQVDLGRLGWSLPTMPVRRKVSSGGTGSPGTPLSQWSNLANRSEPDQYLSLGRQPIPSLPTSWIRQNYTLPAASSPFDLPSAAISADTKTYQPGALDARNEVKREDR
jgi:hypothetical protein